MSSQNAKKRLELIVVVNKCDNMETKGQGDREILVLQEEHEEMFEVPECIELALHWKRHGTG